MNQTHYGVLMFLVILMSNPAGAYWSDDPGQNTILSAAPGGQVIPYAKALPDGGCIVSWYDAGAGYDIRLQRIDSLGEHLWSENGVLVADLNVASVGDYSFDVDASNRTVLACLDTAGNVVANLVDPNGSLLWGSGIQLTDGTGYYANPKAAVLTGGTYVIGWLDEDHTVLQRLNDLGEPQWDPSIALFDPNGGDFIISDLKGAEEGSVIVSFVQYLVFYGEKHLYAQKLDESGSLLWGASHLCVFDSGSLQFGNFPPFTSDGSSGAVFSWYDTAGAILQCYVQHIAAGGSEVFAHNGVAVSTNSSRQRVNPCAAMNDSTGDIFVFWIEENLNQSNWGLYGQRLSPAGIRMWSDDGLTVLPVDAVFNLDNVMLPAGDGAEVYVLDASGTTSYSVIGSRLDINGDFAWTPSPIDVSTASSDKSDIAVIRSSTGQSFLFWSDARSDDGDIYGQNVNPDGSLGIFGGTPTGTPTSVPTSTPSVTPSPSATASSPPEPTETSIPTSTSTPTRTSTPASTSTPTTEPSLTGTPTSEPTCTPTPSPEPTPTTPPLGVRLDMPAMAHTGQEFHVTGFLDNPDNPLYSVPTFFILEVYSDFWFWPDWSHFDPSDPSTVTYTNEEIPTGTKILEVIASFTWPETGPDTITGLRFWGAMLNDDMNVIRGDFAVQEWGYGP